MTYMANLQGTCIIRDSMRRGLPACTAPSRGDETRKVEEKMQIGMLKGKSSGLFSNEAFEKETWNDRFRFPVNFSSLISSETRCSGTAVPATHLVFDLDFHYVCVCVQQGTRTITRCIY